MGESCFDLCCCLLAGLVRLLNDMLLLLLIVLDLIGRRFAFTATGLLWLLVLVVPHLIDANEGVLDGVGILGGLAGKFIAAAFPMAIVASLIICAKACGRPS